MCKQEQNATKNLTKTRQAGLTRPRVMSCNTPTTQHSSCGGREREYEYYVYRWSVVSHQLVNRWSTPAEHWFTPYRISIISIHCTGRRFPVLLRYLYM